MVNNYLANLCQLPLHISMIMTKRVLVKTSTLFVIYPHYQFAFDDSGNFHLDIA